ncbi:MAG: hypothetical protein KGY69_13700 [Bacteroidales bacterium]|nr:hypothetical protein [Bacteroidales bacterium]
MEQLDSKLLEKLSKERSPNSISIYIPTPKTNPGSKEDANRINLKNKLKEAREQMKEQGWQDDEITEYLQPINALTDDALFLRNLWNGLVILLNQNTFEYFRVPMDFDDFMYMGRDFYLLPLLRPLKENISESPKDETVNGLQQKAWSLIQKELDNEKEQMVRKYIDVTNKSDIVEEIIPNILYGRVDTLFVNCRQYVWGKLEPETFDVEIHSERDKDCEDLLNYAAIRAFKHDGNVYLMEPEDMPQKNKLLNAIYRF